MKSFKKYYSEGKHVDKDAMDAGLGEEVAANSVANGGVDMNPTGKPKKMDKRSKYHVEKMFRRAQGAK
jgi:hypothetical protein